MAPEKPVSLVPLLSRALHRIRTTPPRIIASPPTQPRRAAVALIIRIVPSSSASLQPQSTTPPTLTEFFELDWVKDPNARPEILFLHRENASGDEANINQTRVRNTNEAHVAFPGGRTEPDDEGGLYTAMRQTWEEIGIDLAERQYLCIGQLDDREITTSLGKRLLMILSPFVFLQVTPHSPSPDPIPATTLHWTPLVSLVSPYSSPRWSSVTVDAASRLAPKQSVVIRLLIRLLVGTMQFPAIVIEPTSTPILHATHDVLEKGIPPRSHPRKLKLWGLSLGMILDLMSYMSQPLQLDNDTPTSLSSVMQLPYQSEVDGLRMDIVAPSLASVFPRFSYPDVNFWIWVFGKRYREVVREWEASVRSGGINDRRINWSGSALSTFYAAIRKALLVVIVARALGILFALMFTGWWLLSP